MRIRTVKPEFWSHPVMGRLGGDVQALAIGLLNMADDEGYFLADPSSVRSALRPFDEDSTSIRRGLDELSRAGWVAFRTHPEMGLVGQVVKFCSHQRIDRSTPSKLKKYWDSALDEPSTSPRRALDEPSLLEGNREQGREQGREEQHSVEQARPVAARVVDVESLTPDERDVWEHWRNACRHPRAVLTAERLKRIRQWLPVYGVERLQAAIDGCARSPHHQGQNDRGTRYDDLELILRDAKHVEMFEGIARKGAA